MAQAERDITNKILADMPSNQRLFRINAGMGWTGKIAKRTPGMLILSNPRPLHAAPEGWPDLSGWTEIEITPDMVGKKIAVFTGIEVKTGRQKLRDRQEKLGNLIKKMGGFFSVERG